ncbi:MAG: hypothetical protein JXB32_07090 [Deltaproteobacteria bacterium]|nr:hypothetical protein [Deltaproteobacteria bacterium]
MDFGRLTAFGLLFLTVGPVACYGAAPVVRARFENEFRCRNNVSVTSLAGNAYRVSGCGRTAVYSCFNPVGGGGQTTWGGGQLVGGYGGTTCIREADPGSGGPSPAASRARAQAESAQLAVRFDEARGATVVQADLDLSPLRLQCLGAPQIDAGRVLVVLSTAGSVFTCRCPALALVGDDTSVELPLSAEDRPADATTIRFDATPEQIAAAAAAFRLEVRCCDAARSVNARQSEVLRQFVARFREIVAATPPVAPPEPPPVPQPVPTAVPEAPPEPAPTPDVAPVPEAQPPT